LIDLTLNYAIPLFQRNGIVLLPRSGQFFENSGMTIAEKVTFAMVRVITHHKNIILETVIFLNAFATLCEKKFSPRRYGAAEINSIFNLNNFM
jgi:hypothetical protein